MKLINILGVVGMTFISSYAAAQGAPCSVNSSSYISPAKLTALVTGKTVKAGTDSNELHQVGGDVIEYAKGPGHPIDPSKKVGTYAITNSTSAGLITYSYLGGTTFAYKVRCTSTTSATFFGASPGAPASVSVTIN